MVFEADWSGLYPFVRPLVLRLAARPSITVVVVTRESEISRIRNWMHREVPRGRRRASVTSYQTLASVGLRPALLVSCQPFSGVADNWQDIPKVQLLHGMADKRGQLFGPRKLTDFTHLFSPAPVVTELARRRLLGDRIPQHDQLKIVEVGCPKTDDLLDGTYDRKEVLQDLGLPADRPTVLYAPTWEKEASLEQHGEKIISTLSELDTNLLVKPHPLTVADRKDAFLIENGHRGKPWPRILERWERRHTNMRWVRDSYANPFLVAADLLVSEGSGIAFEYVLLDKPIVIIDTPLVSQRHGVDNLHHRLRTCGAVLPSLDDLGAFVKRHLNQPGATAADRGELIRQLAYNPGRATDAAIQFLDRLL